MKKFLIGFTIALAISIPVIAQVIPPGGATAWAVQHTPAAATAATISVAATNQLRHVATSVTACITATAVQGPVIVNLRDGATGAGTILWTTRLASQTAGTVNCQSVAGYWKGSNNVAMTLETASAPAATNLATVSMSGYDDRY
jgi:hypothetical protein